MSDKNLEHLIEATLIANRSAIWWQVEMNRGLAQLKRFDEEIDPYHVSEEREELEKKIEYLIAKGQWEDKNLDKIMTGVERLDKADKRHVVSEMNKRWEEYVRQSDTPHKNNSGNKGF
jgi:hypothetical protein